MYSKAHQILGAWEDSPSPTPRNGSRTPSLRLKSANMSGKGSIGSLDNAPNPEPQVSKNPFHRLLHSRSALSLGMKCRRERNVDSPMPQTNRHTAQWPPYGNVAHGHSVSAALTCSSRNSSAHSSAFHLPFRQHESSIPSRSGSRASQNPPIQPGPNAFRNIKNLAIQPARLSMISSSGTRSPLLETPIIENMFQPQELQEAGKMNGPARHFSRFSRGKISSGLRRIFPNEHQPEPRTSKPSGGTELDTTTVPRYERNSYDPTTNYFHGFDGDSTVMENDAAAGIGQAHGYDPRTETSYHRNFGDPEDEHRLKPNIEYQYTHALTTTDEPEFGIGSYASDSNQGTMSAHSRDGRSTHSYTSKHSSGHVAKYEDDSFQSWDRTQIQAGMTMLTLSDSDDSDEDRTKKAKQVKLVQPAAINHLSDVEEEDFIEEDSLQSQYAHICAEASADGTIGNSSTFASSRSTQSNFDERIRALYDSDDQEQSDRTSITSTDSLVPLPLSAAQSRPSSGHKPHRVPSFEKKERKQGRISRSNSTKRSSDDLKMDSGSQTMAVTPEEFALISSLRKKRAAMQRQLLKEGYRTAMKEQLAKWESLRERAFSDLEAAADLENKDPSKRPARRPSLPSSPKKRPHNRSATFGDIPSGRKRAKSNEDIPDLPLPRPVKMKDFEPPKSPESATRESKDKKVESEKKDEEASDLSKRSKATASDPAIPMTPRHRGQVSINSPPASKSGPTDAPVPPSPEDIMRASWAMVNHELAKNKFPVRPSIVRKSSKATVSEKSTSSFETKANAESNSVPPSEVYSNSDLNSIGEKEETAEMTPTNTSDKLAPVGSVLIEEAATVPLPSSPTPPKLDQVNAVASSGHESPNIFGRTSPIPSEPKRDTIIFSPVSVASVLDEHGNKSSAAQPASSDEIVNRNLARWSSVDDQRESLDEEELLLMLDDAVSQNGFSDHIRTPESQIGMAYEPDYMSPGAIRSQPSTKYLEQLNPSRRVVTGGSPSAPPKTSLPLAKSPASLTLSRSQQPSISHANTLAPQPKLSKIPTPTGAQRAPQHSHVPSFSRPRPHNPPTPIFNLEEPNEASQFRSREQSRIPAFKMYHSSPSSQSTTPTIGRSRRGSVSAANDVLRAWDDLGGYP